MTSELRFTEKTNGLILVLIALVGVLAFAATFRPHRSSRFSEGSAAAPSWGSDSIMFGASPRLGAAE